MNGVQLTHPLSFLLCFSFLVIPAPRGAFAAVSALDAA
jgi:hypothetical protein